MSTQFLSVSSNHFLCSFLSEHDLRYFWTNMRRFLEKWLANFLCIRTWVLGFLILKIFEYWFLINWFLIKKDMYWPFKVKIRNRQLAALMISDHHHIHMVKSSQVMVGRYGPGQHTPMTSRLRGQVQGHRSHCRFSRSNFEIYICLP